MSSDRDSKVVDVEAQEVEELHDHSQPNLAQGIVAMALNFGCSVLIIPFNKWLFKELAFPFVLLLSCFHMLTTGLTTYALMAAGKITYKAIPWREVIFVGCLNAACLACMNLSLSTNSIGVYQLAKMLSVPVVTLLSWSFWGKTYSRETILSLVLMTAGIALAVGQRVSLTLTGLLFAAGGIAFGSLAVILSGEVQRKYSLNSSLFVWYIMHPQLVACLLVALCFEPLLPWQANSAWEYEWSSPVVTLILSTCALASLLNISGLWVVGVFSATTFTVVGYAKTAAVLSAGILVFGDEFNIGIGLGVCLVFGGLILYQRSR